MTATHRKPTSVSASARGLAILAVTSILASCNVTSNPFYSLGIPYRAQESFNYCGAASVQMWRLYDRLSEVSQKEIHDWMFNYWPACGSNQLGIQEAVNTFTNTRDAYWDRVYPQDFESAITRQITSMDSRVPVIAVVDYNHTVIINGGTWHDDGELYVWDTVYAHDPAWGANRQYTAADWLDAFCYDTCEQIVSYSAVGSWITNKRDFAHRVVYEGAPLVETNPWEY